MNPRIIITLLVALVFTSVNLNATGSPSASRGKIRIGLAGFPTSLLHYFGFDEYSEAITSLVLEPLVRADPQTLTPLPALAQVFSSSPDHLVFNFQLDPAARFSDGTAVTADDVLYTWEALRDPSHRSLAYAAQFSEFDRIEKKGSLAVAFHAKHPIALGIECFEDFYVLPKASFSKGDFNRDFNESFLGSGPYQFEKVEWGKSVLLKKNPHYWAQGKPESSNRFHFDQIEFISHSDQSLLYEMFKRDELDYFYFLSSKLWETDTSGPLYQKGFIKKLKAENQTPFLVSGLAWNLRRPLFQDKRVRLALAELLDRPRFIREFYFNQYLPAAGIAHSRSAYHHPENHPVTYAPEQAKLLLQDAGWKLNQNGLLEKDGKPFRFEILSGSPGATKFLTLYQEDLRKAGIQVSLRMVDWATYLRLRNEGNFDAADFGRNRDPLMGDLSLTWSSEGANNPASGNVTGYSNPKVDALLKKLSKTFAHSSRAKIIQAIDLLIGQDQPLAFFWEPYYFRIAYWDRFTFKEPGYFPYSNWRNLFHSWRWDPEKAAHLAKVHPNPNLP